MQERHKKLLNSFGYVGLFCLCFLFFVYVTFPYGVLKEALSSQIGKATGLVIRIKKFGPSFPLGFEAENVQVMSAGGGPALELASMDVSLSLLNIFIGRAAIDIELESKNKGRLEVSTRMPIWQLVVNQTPLPSILYLKADRFAIGHVVGFLLARQAHDPSANPLISGMLTKIGMQGNLDGLVDLDLDTDNFALSEGSVNLQIKDGILTVDDPSLNLADQKFNKAILRAQMKKGNLTIEKESGLHTQGLVADFSGNVNLNKEFPKSALDVAISLQLLEGLKDQFGLILDIAGGNGGALKYQVRGTIARPNVINL